MFCLEPLLLFSYKIQSKKLIFCFVNVFKKLLICAFSCTYLYRNYEYIHDMWNGYKGVTVNAKVVSSIHAGEMEYVIFKKICFRTVHEAKRGVALCILYIAYPEETWERNFLNQQSTWHLGQPQLNYICYCVVNVSRHLIYFEPFKFILFCKK